MLVGPGAAVIPLPLSGTFPGTGVLSLPLQLPIPATCGTPAYLQAWIPDSGAPNGRLSATNGVILLIP